MNVFTEFGCRRLPVLHCLISCLFFLCVSGDYGGMRVASSDGQGAQTYVECFMNTVPTGFIGLTIFDLVNEHEALVSLKDREKECKTHGKYGRCNFSGNGSTVSASTIIEDLAEDETRTYGCNASYFDVGLRHSVKTETYTINITKPRRNLTSTPPVRTSTTTKTSSGDAPTVAVSISTIPTSPSGAVTASTLSVSISTTSGNPTEDKTTANVSTNLFLGSGSERTYNAKNNIGTGAGVVFVLVTAAVVVVWTYRRRCGWFAKYTGVPPNHWGIARGQPARGPAMNPPEMTVHAHLDDDYSEVAMGTEAPAWARTRPLPRRPTSEESDYQELASSPSPNKSFPDNNTEAAAGACMIVKGDGPYADVKDAQTLLEQAEKSGDKDSDAEAACHGYVPLRDIAKRKKRTREIRAKRATVI